MKVLFAVSDEKVSLSIVKKYQREYKEIISYKNVYYFNAILKELQRDKTYDRVVIDEELEEFTSTSYEEKDKFIFNKLDGITDEASNVNGTDIPILLICSDRRTKSEEILVKLFGIGIYNAIIGNDRSTDEVCRLLNNPRSKKDAKLYYRIDSKAVDYDPERENDVSEEEMQHILTYFKNLGRNEEKYVEAFRKIVSQYNEKQLKVIVAILPTNVKATLEELSPEYQRIVMSTGKPIQARKPIIGLQQPRTSERLFNGDNENRSGRSPIVVPSSIDSNMIKKVTIRKPSILKEEPDEYDEYDDEEEEKYNDFEPVKEENEGVLPGFEEEEEEEEDNENSLENDINSLLEENENVEEKDEEDDDIFEDVAEPTAPRKRGRPPKKIAAPSVVSSDNTVKRKRGRPPKKVVSDDSIENQDEFKDILPGFEDTEKEEVKPLEEYEPINEDLLGPKFDEEELDDEEELLPGLDQEDDETEEIEPLEEDNKDEMLPGFESREENEEQEETGEKPDFVVPNRSIDEDKFSLANDINKEIQSYEQNYYDDYDYTNYNSLLSSERKVIAFVGTSKNGTSFIVNNVANILAENGIDTAILDATQNKNSYYIFNNNDDAMRITASNSINSLIDGAPVGMQVSKNLSVYVEIPGQKETMMHKAGPILENLIKKHSAVLIDCDFNTPLEYFSNAQEIYLVQSMDVLTIQPLTAFLKELKNRDILDQKKLRIIVNKMMRLKGITSKQIVGGMSNYNNPEMSIMTELFDRNMMVPIEIPFDIDVYARYLEGLAECNININKYPKEFQNILKKLVSVIYPLLPSKGVNNRSRDGYQYSSGYSNGFSNSVNNTLNNMRKNY